MHYNAAHLYTERLILRICLSPGSCLLLLGLDEFPSSKFHPTLNNTSRAEITACIGIGAISFHPRIFKQCYIVKAFFDPNIRTSLHGPAGQCGYAKKRLRSISTNLAVLIFASCACKPSTDNSSDDADTCDFHIGAPRWIGPLLSGAGSACLLGLGLGHAHA